MTIDRRKVLLRIGMALTVVAACCGVYVVMTWPMVIASEERELTGLEFHLDLIAQVNDGSYREGYRAWVYRIPPTAATAINADRNSLTTYPMWSALCFDGYKLVRWKPIQAIRASEDRILLERVFDCHSTDVAPEQVRTVEDARHLATSIANGKSALIASWYSSSEGIVTNYFVYVIDLEHRLLIKLSLTT